MSYYHVLITTSDDLVQLHCIAADLNESNLKKLVICPYKKGKTIVIEGRIYPAPELRSIQIINTKSDAELTLDAATYDTNQELAKLNTTISSNLLSTPFNGYTLNDIGDFGEDVTKKYIWCAPGEGGISLSVKFIKEHQLIPAVLTAILAAAIAFFVK